MYLQTSKGACKKTSTDYSAKTETTTITKKPVLLGYYVVWRDIWRCFVRFNDDDDDDDVEEASVA